MAEKIRDLAAGLNKAVTGVLNKMPSEEVAQKLEGELKNWGIEIIGTIPDAPLVFEACLEGRGWTGEKLFVQPASCWTVCWGRNST